MNKKQNTWLVVFDATICRIYEYRRNHVDLIKEIQHPENRLKDSELTTDRPGRYKASARGGFGIFNSESDPKKVQIENFSREIARILEHERTVNAYEHLILAGNPHMNGLLHKHITKPVQDLIIHKIDKNLVHLTGNDLLNSISKSL